MAIDYEWTDSAGFAQFYESYNDMVSLAGLYF